jgi:hypothetical protein
VKHMPLRIADPRDNVVLFIYYYNPAFDGLLERKLQLTNTLNKSEEQIFAAIELFRNLR